MTSGSERRPLLAPIAELYGRSLAEHGAASRAVGWKDEAEQRLRFDKLLAVVPDVEAPTTVADLGCGYGAMFRYLDERLPRLQRYVGYEISTAMLAAARAAIVDSRASFVESPEPTEEVDWSFASGTFNVKADASDEEWTAYVEASTLRLAETSRRGFAFNLLSSHVDWREPHLFYADPARFFDFCKRRCSRYVTLVHDYPLYEWTILVRREP